MIESLATLPEVTYRHLYMLLLYTEKGNVECGRSVLGLAEGQHTTEINNITAHESVATTRRAENKCKDISKQQLTPSIIPAISTVPNHRLASNANS